MIRILGLLLVLVIAAVVVVVALSVALIPRRTSAGAPEDRLPSQVRTVSYILLILLLLGISTGLIWRG